MSEKQKMLELRTQMKKRKPVFCRKDCNKKKRIEDDVWRKPRGCDNKQRLKRKGHRKNPSSGYRSPIIIRGLHHSGLMPVLVTTESQIEALTKEHGIIISSKTGGRKKKSLIALAVKKGIRVLNLDVNQTVSEIDTKVKERQAERKKKAEEKQKKGLDEKVKKESNKEKEAKL
jgi:large subunit ribosomal protein L32e